MSRKFHVISYQLIRMIIFYLVTFFIYERLTLPCQRFRIIFTNISKHSRQIKTDESFQPNKQQERKQKAKLSNLMKIYYI